MAGLFLAESNCRAFPSNEFTGLPTAFLPNTVYISHQIGTPCRTGSNLSALGPFSRERAFVPDEEVEAAAELMRQLTPQASGEVGAGGSGEQPPPALEQLSEAVDQGSVHLASAALREEAAEEDRPPVTALSAPAAIAPLPGEAQATMAAPAAAGAGASSADAAGAAGAPPEPAAAPSLRAAAPAAAEAAAREAGGKEALGRIVEVLYCGAVSEGRPTPLPCSAACMLRCRGDTLWVED